MAQKFIPATSQDVRQYFAKHPKKIPAGAEKSVQVSCKGRVKPNAIDVFNKDAKIHGMKYVEGNTKAVALSYKARNNRVVTVHLPMHEVRSLAGKSGVKGPLSAADRERAIEALLSR